MPTVCVNRPKLKELWLSSASTHNNGITGIYFKKLYLSYTHHKFSLIHYCSQRHYRDNSTGLSANRMKS